jgi:uncharacterized protein (UPF0147 family)
LTRSVNLHRHVLRQAQTTWENARGAQDYHRAYTDAVHDTYRALKQVFVAPDIGAGLHSTAYWNLLPIGGARVDPGVFQDMHLARNVQRAMRAENQALTTEIDKQVRSLERARSELEALKKLAARPGLPVVHDTNMLNHWHQPGDILWRDVRGDADLSILRCAADLDNLHPDTGARVLTDDIGMRLRARQMDLKVLRLPEKHRKKGTALDDAPPQI